MAQTNPGPIQAKPTTDPATQINNAMQNASATKKPITIDKQNAVQGQARGRYDQPLQTPAQQINSAMQTAATPTQTVQDKFAAASQVISDTANRFANQVQQAQQAGRPVSAQTQANAQTTQEATGGIYRVGDNGQAPKGLKVGDQVVTGGGTYTIKSVNPDGTYQSQLTNPNQTTGNYGGQYANAPVAPTNVYRVGADGKAPTGLKVGDQVVTAGGTYQITGINVDGTYQSQLVNRDQTTANYTGAYATAPGTAPATQQPQVPNFAQGYQSGIDYTNEIQKALARGDLAAAAYFEQQRNAKIDAEGLGDKYAKTNQYSQYLSQLTPERQAQLMNGYVAQSSYPENPRDRWMQWAEDWAKNQKGLVDTQIDYATNQGILEAQRAEEDAQPKFQQQLNQNDIDTARAMSNSALYAEMRGDRGGIGQSQYNEVQAAGLRAKQEINSARTKLATDTARAIADLRSKGEFQKAESYMKIQNELMAKYFEIENAILNYGISRAEYEQAKEQADFNRDYQIANLLGTYNGQPTQSSQRYNQEQLIANAQWKLATGIMPTAEELAALGITAADAATASWNLSNGAYGIGTGNFSSGGSSGGGGGSSSYSGSGSGGSGSGGSGSGGGGGGGNGQKAPNAALTYAQPKNSAPTPWQKPVKGYDM